MAEIRIEAHDEYEKGIIGMFLSDIYAEAAKTEPTEEHLEESRKEESTPTEPEPKGESTMKENTNAAAQAETAKSTNIDLSPLPCLNGENIPCFVPDSYLGLYSTAQALKENADNPENAQYFREQIKRILKKYIADAENILAVYGTESLEIFEYAEIFNSFIYGELSEEINTAKEKGLKIFAEYHTEADTSPTGSPEAVDDWSGVKFERIPGIPDPEAVGAESSDKLTEALEKLDRMRHKLDKSTYTNSGNSRYYNGFWSAVCCIFGEVLYDTETGKHYLPVSEAAAQPEEATQAEENNAETMQTAEAVTEPEQEEQTADETIKFETGKIYYAIHITNSDYISAYRVISRTTKTIILENSSGERFRKRPTVTDGYINGKKCHCETVCPDGVYSMCLALRATDTVNADTPKQAEQDYFRQQQERTAAAVAHQRQYMQQVTRIDNTRPHITMTAGAAN